MILLDNLHALHGHVLLHDEEWETTLSRRNCKNSAQL